jgi:hypothetical protein
MTKDLVTIVYFSSARHRFNEIALVDLLRVARRNNERDGITGMLLYHDGNFIQAIEGPPDAVVQTFARIRTNPAHDGVISIGPLPLEERQFPTWTMGFLASTQLPADAQRSINKFLNGRWQSDERIRESVAWSLLKTFRQGLPSAA